MCAEVGKDGQQRFEEDMGLEIDPDTGRPYKSQGEATNQTLGFSGRFHDGMMVPRSFQCTGCGGVVMEKHFGQGFENCGLIDLGPGGKYNLCPECILKALAPLPNLRALVAAMNGGDLKGG